MRKIIVSLIASLSLVIPTTANAGWTWDEAVAPDGGGGCISGQTWTDPVGGVWFCVGIAGQPGIAVGPF